MMVKESPPQLRLLIAQQAAKMMAEEGISDYAHAKKKAGRHFEQVAHNVLPSNAEIEEALKCYNALFLSDKQPENLVRLRKNALFTMQLLEKFNPHLTGAVLDGSAGLGSETHIHLFADSLKEVEIFLLNQNIPFRTNEKSHHELSDKRDKRTDQRKIVPVFSLEMDSGIIKLSVFEMNDIRLAGKRATDSRPAIRMSIAGVKALLNAPTSSAVLRD